jgi:hypothetical protein
MILTIFTLAHVTISLVGIFAGFAVLFGLLGGRRLDRWTLLFLVTTALTSITGFFFPFHGFTPAIGVGIISLLVLVLAIYARYVCNLTGAWRKTYVITALFALYLNVFVLIVQSFQKIPAFNELAPTQNDPPFKITQLVVLVAFIVLGIVATIKFRNEPAASSAMRPMTRSGAAS